MGTYIWDWELALKLIPLVNGIITILVACFVYKVWHKQKEKEFIANEAKDILRIVDSLKSSYYVLSFQNHCYFNSKENFNESYYYEACDENNTLKKDFNSRLTFLLDLIEDCTMYEIYKKYELNQTFFEVSNVFNDGIEKLDELNASSREIEIYLDRIKLKLVNYAMYKNKIRAKSI